MPIQFRGVTLDQSTADKFVLSEKWIRHDLNDPTFTLEFPQGSYSTSVAASGGTHSGGGVADVHCLNFSQATKVIMMKRFRAVLGFGWHRPFDWDGANGGEHMHIGELGNPHMSQALKDQVVQWNAGENGLANHNADSEAIDRLAGRPARITTPPPVPVVPAPAADPKKQLGNDMLIIQYPKKTAGKSYTWHGDFLLSGSALYHIVSVEDEAAFAKAGVKVAQVSYAQYVALGGK